jgi:hypothetical protein
MCDRSCVMCSAASWSHSMATDGCRVARLPWDVAWTFACKRRHICREVQHVQDHQTWWIIRQSPEFCKDCWVVLVVWACWPRDQLLPQKLLVDIGVDICRVNQPSLAYIHKTCRSFSCHCFFLLLAKVSGPGRHLGAFSPWKQVSCWHWGLLGPNNAENKSRKVSSIGRDNGRERPKSKNKIKICLFPHQTVQVTIWTNIICNKENASTIT